MCNFLITILCSKSSKMKQTGEPDKVEFNPVLLLACLYFLCLFLSHQDSRYMNTTLTQLCHFVLFCPMDCFSLKFSPVLFIVFRHSGCVNIRFLKERPVFVLLFVFLSCNMSIIFSY